jgi:hypothetical protein
MVRGQWFVAKGQGELGGEERSLNFPADPGQFLGEL